MAFQETDIRIVQDGKLFRAQTFLNGGWFDITGSFDSMEGAQTAAAEVQPLLVSQSTIEERLTQVAFFGAGKPIPQTKTQSKIAKLLASKTK